jgi:Mycothiol maleylpyruvate isomerase N-terminal domain
VSVRETDVLIADLQRERDALFAILDAVEPGSLTTPGLLGEWSARELIAHLGYWTGHATEVIHLLEVGRIEEDDLGGRTVDEINATVARIARDTPLATVRKREAASVEALVERLRTLDPAHLSEVLPDGATLDRGIREDASDHYREHAEQLRQVLEEPARG